MPNYTESLENATVIQAVRTEGVDGLGVSQKTVKNCTIWRLPNGLYTFLKRRFWEKCSSEQAELREPTPLLTLWFGRLLETVKKYGTYMCVRAESLREVWKLLEKCQTWHEVMLCVMDYRKMKLDKL